MREHKGGETNRSRDGIFKVEHERWGGGGGFSPFDCTQVLIALSLFWTQFSERMKEGSLQSWRLDFTGGIFGVVMCDSVSCADSWFVVKGGGRGEYIEGWETFKSSTRVKGAFFPSISSSLLFTLFFLVEKKEEFSS